MARMAVEREFAVDQPAKRAIVPVIRVGVGEQHGVDVGPAQTGLLKAFFDRFGTNALAGVVAVPMMMGGAPIHFLAVDTHLTPLLQEIGASCPTRGLFILESELDALDTVVERWRAGNESILTRLLR